MDTRPVALGDMIREAREERGWTQDELAERLGVARQTVGRWETGGGVPNIPDQFNSVVSALGLSAEEALLAMGVRVYPPAAARLPRDLIDVLLSLSPEQQRVLLDFVRPLAAMNGSAR